MEFSDIDDFYRFLRGYIKENLRVNIKTSSNYTGGMDGGNLYEDSHTIQILLEDEVISEDYL